MHVHVRKQVLLQRVDVHRLRVLLRIPAAPAGVPRDRGQLANRRRDRQRDAAPVVGPPDFAHPDIHDETTRHGGLCRKPDRRADEYVLARWSGCDRLG